MSVQLGNLLMDPNFSKLVASVSAQVIQAQQNIQAQGQENPMTQATVSALPQHVLAHLVAKGFNATDISEVESRVNKAGRLPAKYSVAIKEVRAMLKATVASTPSEVSADQLLATLGAPAPTAPAAKAKASKAAPAGQENWGTPKVVLQLGASTRLQVNVSSQGRIGFRVFFKRQADNDYSPSKNGFALSPEQVAQLKAAL